MLLLKGLEGLASLADLFRNIDSNNTGNIDFNEFIQAVR